MASVNKAILVGNLGRDPEVRYTPSGAAVCNLSLATTSTWKDKNTGERREDTEWHKVVLYNRLAEVAGEYLRKGSSVYIEGRIKTRKWQDKDGQDRYTTEIEAAEMKMLGGRGDGDGGRQHGGEPPSQQGRQQQRPADRAGGAQGGQHRQSPPPQSSRGFDDLEDDIPFD